MFCLLTDSKVNNTNLSFNFLSELTSLGHESAKAKHFLHVNDFIFVHRQAICLMGIYYIGMRRHQFRKKI